MLRIRINNDPPVSKLVLEGELVGPWVSELQFVWKGECSCVPARQWIVDLNEVTRVDEAGRVVLAKMKAEGAELHARGVSMKHLIRGLKKNAVQ